MTRDLFSENPDQLEGELVTAFENAVAVHRAVHTTTDDFLTALFGPPTTPDAEVITKAWLMIPIGAHMIAKSVGETGRQDHSRGWMWALTPDALQAYDGGPDTQLAFRVATAALNHDSDSMLALAAAHVEVHGGSGIVRAAISLAAICGDMRDALAATS